MHRDYRLLSTLLLRQTIWNVLIGYPQKLCWSDRCKSCVSRSKRPAHGHFLLDLGIDPNVVNDESKNIFMALVDRQDLAFLNTRTSDFFPFFDRLLKLDVSPKQTDNRGKCVLHKSWGMSMPVLKALGLWKWVEWVYTQKTKKWFVEVGGVDVKQKTTKN
eukprot:Phypoly_transcript_08664.p1 GENE.Phypoly_transcript_08664~~Phypoly_transcript_08664.p1  ORF type:complete len:160 (+),score=10.32 Phypoly_transcript_08664:569-1048(+)